MARTGANGVSVHVIMAARAAERAMIVRGFLIGSRRVRAALAGALAVGMVMVALAASAQQPQPAAEDSGFFASVSRWFSRQATNISSTFKDASKGVEDFGDKAGDTARTTVNEAKGAADAVVRIPGTR